LRCIKPSKPQLKQSRRAAANQAILLSFSTLSLLFTETERNLSSCLVQGQTLLKLPQLSVRFPAMEDEREMEPCTRRLLPLAAGNEYSSCPAEQNPERPGLAAASGYGS